MAKTACFEELKKLKKYHLVLDFQEKALSLWCENNEQLALATKKVIYIPMSRNVVREHFESRDMFFRRYDRH